MISLQSYRFLIGMFDAICKKSSSKIKSKPSKIKLSIYFFIFSFILLNTATSYDNYIQKSNNKVFKSINGNISKNGSYFLMSWNKGNSKFSNKRDDIAITLDRHRPDIFSIHEANFNANRDKGFQKYNIEAKYLNSDYSTDARTILLLRQGIIFNRRHDLEDKHISII